MVPHQTYHTDGQAFVLSMTGRCPDQDDAGAGPYWPGPLDNGHTVYVVADDGQAARAVEHLRHTPTLHSDVVFDGGRSVTTVRAGTSPPRYLALERARADDTKLELLRRALLRIETPTTFVISGLAAARHTEALLAHLAVDVDTSRHAVVLADCGGFPEDALSRHLGGVRASHAAEPLADLLGYRFQPQVPSCVDVPLPAFVRAVERMHCAEDPEAEVGRLGGCHPCVRLHRGGPFHVVCWGSVAEGTPASTPVDATPADAALLLRMASALLRRDLVEAAAVGRLPGRGPFATVQADLNRRAAALAADAFKCEEGHGVHFARHASSADALGGALDGALPRMEALAAHYR